MVTFGEVFISSMLLIVCVALVVMIVSIVESRLEKKRVDEYIESILGRITIEEWIVNIEVVLQDTVCVTTFCDSLITTEYHGQGYVFTKFSVDIPIPFLRKGHGRPRYINVSGNENYMNAKRMIDL